MRKLLISSVLLLSVFLAIACATLNQYVNAIVWHCEHGSFAELAGHRVRLPIQWRSQGQPAYGNSVLSRACPFGVPVGAQIIAGPTVPGELKNSEQAALEAQQTMASIMNRKSPQGWSSSVVVLRSQHLTLYCRKDDVAPVQSNLFCLAANVPVSFSYQGASNWEKEAEAILSTVE